MRTQPYYKERRTKCATENTSRIIPKKAEENSLVDQNAVTKEAEENSLLDQNAVTEEAEENSFSSQKPVKGFKRRGKIVFCPHNEKTSARKGKGIEEKSGRAVQ